MNLFRNKLLSQGLIHIPRHGVRLEDVELFNTQTERLCRHGSIAELWSGVKLFTSFRSEVVCSPKCPELG